MSHIDTTTVALQLVQSMQSRRHLLLRVHVKKDSVIKYLTWDHAVVAVTTCYTTCTFDNRYGVERGGKMLRGEVRG